MHYPLFFEFIGTSELCVVAFVALLIFGPRKLPEMARSCGQALHQLRNASNDFKRTWELETLAQPALGGPALTHPVLAQPVFVQPVEAVAALTSPAVCAEPEALEVNAS
jgi:TatA/E family protein of Tat protein translocase